MDLNYLRDLDVIFNGDVVKVGEKTVIVLDTRTINFYGINTSNGKEEGFFYSEVDEVLALGIRGLKEQLMELGYKKED